MRDIELDNIIELMRIVKDQEREQEQDIQKSHKDMKFRPFDTFADGDSIRPIISVDGSYSFLFSFLGADTWIVLFRIAVTDYKLIQNGPKTQYIINRPLQVYDTVHVLSFNKNILLEQPPVFRLAKRDAEKFKTRKQIIFAANIMTYLEHKTLERISNSYSDCILFADGSLVSVKRLKRQPVFNKINRNCVRNNILFAGVSKTTSTHFFNDFYCDDHFLKKFHDKVHPTPTYIEIPKVRFDTKYQKRFARHGEIHFAKLNEHAEKWFRVDIGNDNGDKDAFFSQIAAYSKVHTIPGYPIGLIEAHKVAKTVRQSQIKNYYENKLIGSLEKIGLTSQEILDGAVDIDGEHWRSFHETLDLASL